jgi:thymidylate synthase
VYSYQALLKDILKNGEPHRDRTGTGTLSVFGRQWRHDLTDGFPLLTTKKVSLRWVAEELFWFLSGSTNEKDLRIHGVDIWKEWAKSDGSLGPIYGYQWRKWGGDQIKRVITQLQRDRDSRRIICSAWNADDIDDMALPPCHTLWQVKVHTEGSLSLHVYCRSIDTFLGLPFNIASYALLLQMLAHTTGYMARELIMSFGDLHIYNNHIDQCKLQLEREPKKLPTLLLDGSLYGHGLKGLLLCKWEDIRLIDYEHHPKIEGEISV